jgi:hypothetical protein
MINAHDSCVYIIIVIFVSSFIFLSCAYTTDETDYTPLNPDMLDVLLIFNNAIRRQCFTVRITSDAMVEGPEHFSLRLLEDPFFPPPIPTTFNASLATVTILD